jgi:oxygen-independent coproporphyrinogen-3 oxidase
VERNPTTRKAARAAPESIQPWSLCAPAGTPLYIHVPFCEAKCPYCDFFSVAAEGQNIEGSLEALRAELERRAPKAPRTIFVGGGTPSWLSIPQLTELFDALHNLTGFRDSTLEVTVECNPESLDAEKARALTELGATRLSIGFQSLRPETLKLFGRVHDVDDSFRAYEAARAANPRGVSIDLIFGAEGQTTEEWAEDLDRVLALRPDHISCYALTFEEGTQFTRWLKSGKLKRTPEEQELALFRLTREHVTARGYQAYEVSNFALSGQECAHNINYWRNGPYVGVGPGAASYLEGLRFGNPRALEPWRRSAVGADDPTHWSERLEPAHRLAETWWLGLRLAEGLDPMRARQLAGVAAAEDPCLPVAERLTREGLLSLAEGSYHLTPRGLELADAIASDLLAAGNP